jgi:hypothetical protein
MFPRPPPPGFDFGGGAFLGAPGVNGGAAFFGGGGVATPCLKGTPVEAGGAATACVIMRANGLGGFAIRVFPG